MDSLKGKKVFIAGGTNGAGLETVKLLAKENTEIFVTGRTYSDELKSLCADNRNIVFFQWDFSLHSPNDFILQPEVNAALSSADILICTFGPFVYKDLHDVTPQEWLTLTQNDLAFPGILCSSVLTGMMNRKFGRIILFGGTRTDSINAYKKTAAYSACKTALSVIVKSIAASYAQKNITCNAILPGFTHDAPSNTEVTPASFLAQQAMHLIQNHQLNGVLFNCDRGWQPE